ncbi:MAG: hypothetical protein WD114_04080, partial [Phycisphaerales bacterium]
GLRGICFVGDEIYIAASDELFVFDQQFNILRSHTCPYLHHCHEICADNAGSIYLSATSFDSVLRFNIADGEFDKGWWMRPAQRVVNGKTVTALDTTVFDPNEPGGPPNKDTLHINNVVFAGGVCMFSGLAMNLLVSIIDDQTQPYALVPPTTHNCQPLGKGIVMNSTGKDALILTDRHAKIRKSFKYPRYDKSTLTNTDIPGDFARQAFGRGLCIDQPNRLVIAGSSPGTVSAFEVGSDRMVASVQVSNDLRNAPHGLEIWPY